MNNNVMKLHQVQTHECKDCGITKPLTDFPKKSSSKCGYSLTRCKPCQVIFRKMRKGDNSLTISTKMLPDGVTTHRFTKPEKNIPLKSKYEILNPKIYDAWVEMNKDNKVLIEQLDIVRTDMLKGRDAWAEREFHAANACGFLHSPDLHGADAYTQSGQPIEIKVNWVSDNPSNNNVLNGAGRFNDYSLQRFNNLVDKGYGILVACYVDHRMICAVEVPMSYEPFANKLHHGLTNSKNRICMQFTFNDWVNCPDVKWHVLPDVKMLFKYQHKFSPNFFEHILGHVSTAMNSHYTTSVDIK